MLHRTSPVFRWNLRRRLLSLLTSIVTGYVLVLAILRIFESHLIFFPDYPNRLASDWHPRGLPVEDVRLATSDGTKLHAWWIPQQDAKFTFLAFHGNAGNVADRHSVYEFLRDTPANVLALEYRGYGRSQGKPTEAGFYQDSDAAFAYLVNGRGLDPNTIISFGQSLGTAVAAQLAAEHRVGAVVLEAPFLSATRVARQIFWFLPGTSLLVYSQFDTQARLQKISAPILIVHCTQDPVLPFRLGQEVYDAAPVPKTFLAIDGYCHEEASAIATAEYHAALRKFLSSIPPHDKSP
jgi:uncharacterized protein